MKRFLVLAACFILTSPAFVAADDACGCGEKDSAKAAAGGKGTWACPLFEVDVYYWYCDYYPTSCDDVPSVCYLDGDYSPTWACPSGCQAATKRDQKHASKAQQQKRFDPEHTPQHPIEHGPGVGLKPRPKVSDVHYQNKLLFVSFTHPLTDKTVIAQAKRIDWDLIDPANGNPAPHHGTKWRFAALEVVEASEKPVPIDTFGYKVVMRSVKGPDVGSTPGKPVCSVAIEPDKPMPNPFFSLAVLVWFNDSLPPDCSQR